MTGQEETNPAREESASADVFVRTIRQYGLTEVQVALLTKLFEAEENDGYVSLSALCEEIGLSRGGYMGYRYLTDNVLSPFDYNKTPTWIEYEWIEIEYKADNGRGELHYRLADSLREVVGEFLGK